MGLSAGDDLPPSYTESIITPSPLFPQLPTTTTTTSSSPLTTHLRTLPSRLRATQLARQSAQASHDLALTDLLVRHIEAFLAADLTSSCASASSMSAERGGGMIPPVAELTLVPASAVPAEWGMSGAVERRREGELVRVVRVDMGKVGSGDGDGFDTVGDAEGDEVGGSLGAREAGFDEWGRFDTDGGSGGNAAGRQGGWWFTDEDMASRLAAYLRPEPTSDRKHIQPVVVEKKAVGKEKSGWGRWGLGGGRKKAAEQSSPVVAPPVSPGLSSFGSGAENDSVKMTVTAEEVTFRKENEFGLWESRTGWGIVVTVKVKR
ncbi:hypothetical protein N657DRAFT_674218 [Parathielavia appendiculata]|uniref:Uncharacterized protein n=1 Tax=Parathielavia appendiculata TaxID=2587402 RepID=A0AAN6Z1H8_9PEZI|nr:hypothetical protein N657DRAFT_674218 [Parathielavia appendiculata]